MESLEILLREIKEANNNGNIEECITLCKKGLRLSNIEQFNDWYGLRINMVRFLLMLNKNKTNNIEEAITLIKEMLDTILTEKNPKEWASLQRNLGYLYDKRIAGQRGNNIKKIIEHYMKALTYFSKKEYPEDWAMINAGIGLAYSEKKDGNCIQNVQDAIKHYEQSLQVYKREIYPEDYEDTTKELALLNERLSNFKGKP